MRTFTTKGDNTLEVAKVLLDKFPKELTWLTGSTNATPELGGLPSGQKTVGELLFPSLPKDQLKEFDRTMAGLFTFLWALEGNYDSFVECQPEKGRLTRATFQRLVNYTKLHIRNDEEVTAMCVYLVINDLTKISAIVEEMHQRTGNEQVDHDVLLYETLVSYPESSPSFSSLSPAYQQIILNGLSAKFNFAHLHQAEGPAAILTGLGHIDEKSLNFFLIHAIFDTAGVVGHIKQNGSLSLTETGYKNLESGIKAIQLFRSSKSEALAYESMLVERAKFWNLEVRSKSSHKAVARIGCMLRLGDSDKEKISQIIEAIQGLSGVDQEILIDEMNFSGVKDRAILIYYAPAIIGNLETALKKNNQGNAFQSAIGIAVNIFVKVLKLVRPKIGFNSGPGIHVCMCSDVAKHAGTNPLQLMTAKMAISMIGDDSIIKVENE